MTNTQIGDALSRYAALNSLMLEIYGETCLDNSYNKSISDLQQTSWESSPLAGGRQWFWQTCVEFGFYQSTTSNQQPFGQTLPVEYVSEFRFLIF